ncbi:hypothetical protein CVAR21S_01058 [Corynebacterium variabile]
MVAPPRPPGTTFHAAPPPPGGDRTRSRCARPGTNNRRPSGQPARPPTIHHRAGGAPRVAAEPTRLPSAGPAARDTQGPPTPSSDSQPHRLDSSSLRCGDPAGGDTRFSREASGDFTASSLRASPANFVRRIHPENFSHALVPRLFRGKTFLLSPVPGLALQSPGLIGTACLLGQKTTLNVVVKSWGRVIREALHRLAEFVKADETVVRFVRR